MIRIEIEIDERRPGKVDISCRNFEGCWCQSTKAEIRIAGEIADVMRRDLDCASRAFGTVETFEGEAAVRLRREAQS